MTAKYFAIITNQGAARLANATALGTKLNLTKMAVGDANGTLPIPEPEQTKLINQKRIAPLNLLEVDPNNSSQIIAEQIIPENEGGFWIREIGLYDDEGILIAVANCPETYKPQLQEGSGRTQTIRMILIVSSTSAITLKIDPSVVLATREYVDISVKSFSDESLKIAKNLTDVSDKSAAREALELGTAATKNTGTSLGDVMAVGAFGLGVGPQHRSDAFSNIAQIYRINASSTSTPGGGDYGVVCLPCDGTPSTGYVAVSGGGIAFIGSSNTPANGVKWSRVYTSEDKPSGLLLNTQTFTASGTYKPTLGAKFIRITLTGGGGGGGGCQSHNNTETFSGAGGGAGATVITQFTLTGAASYVITIGSGGVGRLGAANGGGGGVSSFSSLFSAPGGGGGGKSGVSNTAGGSGGTATTGDIRITGGSGADGQSGSVMMAGIGGCSYFGGGGRAGAGGGVSGNAPGSGGGGAYDVSYVGTMYKGGDGASGIAIIEEFS